MPCCVLAYGPNARPKHGHGDGPCQARARGYVCLGHAFSGCARSGPADLARLENYICARRKPMPCPLKPYLSISDQSISRLRSLLVRTAASTRCIPGLASMHIKPRCLPCAASPPTLALRPAVMVPVDGTDSGSCGGRWNTTGTDGRRRHHPATEASLLGVPRTRIDSSSSPSSATCKVPLSFLAYSSR